MIGRFGGLCVALVLAATTACAPSAPSTLGRAEKDLCAPRALDPTQDVLHANLQARVASMTTETMTQQGKPGGGRAGFTMPALLDIYEATGDTAYLDRFVLLGDRVLAARDDRAGLRDYRGRSAAQWSTTAFNAQGSRPISFLIDDARLVAPLARFAALTAQRPCLQGLYQGERTFDAIARTYALAAQETLAFHAAENWRAETVQGMDIGYFVTPHDADFIAPDMPGKPVPLNYQSMAGLAYLYMYKATGEDTYAERATLLANFIQLEFVDAAAPNTLTWPYWPKMQYAPSRGWAVADTSRFSYHQPDDLNHASVTIDFLTAMAAGGVGSVKRQDLQKVANTFHNLVHNKSPVPIYMDGSGPPADRYASLYGRMASLAAVRPDIWEPVCSVVWRERGFGEAEQPLEEDQRARAIASVARLLLTAPMRQGAKASLADCVAR